MSIHQDRLQETEQIEDRSFPFTVFLNWYVLTHEQKVNYGLPTSISDFCEKNKLDRTDVLSFRNHPSWHAEYKKALYTWSIERSMEHLQKLNKKITVDSSTKDIVAFSQISSDLAKSSKSDATQELSVSINLSQNNYEAILQRESEGMRTNRIHEHEKPRD